LGTRLVDILMDPNKKLLKDEGELFEDPNRYHPIVGKLNDLIISMLVILFATSIISKFLEIPRVLDWDAITLIIQYLKRAPSLEIL
jgi:hypothetical protein